MYMRESRLSLGDTPCGPKVCKATPGRRSRRRGAGGRASLLDGGAESGHVRRFAAPVARSDAPVGGLRFVFFPETRARVNHLTLGRSMGERPESLRGILNRPIAAAADRGAVVYCYGHPLVRFFSLARTFVKLFHRKMYNNGEQCHTRNSFCLRTPP